MSLRAVARPLLGGTLDLGLATRLEVGAALSTPARTMAGTFPVRQDPGKLGEVEVFEGNRRLFSGRVDRQALTVSGQGILLELEARSRGALLLDNEAMPCALTNVRLTTVFGLFIAPYGFSCYNPNPAFTLGMYTVAKGLSEWEALLGFTRRAWGITPYVAGDQVMVDRPRSTGALTISNTGLGLPFTRLEHRYIPYKMLSKVVLRDEWGSYSSSVGNSSAAYHGVSRKRYVIPANEFVDAPAMDANQRIRRSMLDGEETLVTLPGFVDAEIGREARIEDAAFSARNLLVTEILWEQGPGGLVTKLWLGNSVYYA